MSFNGSMIQGGFQVDCPAVHAWSVTTLECVRARWLQDWASFCCVASQPEKIQINFFKFIFWLQCALLCGISVPQPGIKPMPLAMGEWILNHWTAREVAPKIVLFPLDQGSNAKWKCPVLTTGLPGNSLKLILI